MERIPEAGDVTSAADKTAQFDDDNLTARAEFYKNEGNDQFKKENLKSAIHYYSEGIKVNCKDKEMNAKLYSNRAAAHINFGNYTEALSDAKISVGFLPSFVRAFVRGASACLLLEKINEAVTWCDKGLAIDPNHQKLLELWNRSAREQKLKCYYEEKETYNAGNINTCHSKTGNFGNRSHVENKDGRSVIALECPGDFKTAIDYHGYRLKVAKELGDKSEEGTAYGNLGIAYESLRDFKSAINYHELNLKIVKDMSNTSGEGRAYCNLGNAHYRLGDFRRAIDYHKRHLKIMKDLGDKLGEGRAYGNLSNAYRSLGDFKTAIYFLNCDLANAKELGDRLRERRAYLNLGNAYRNLGDFKTAVGYLESDLKIAKELGEKSGEGKAYGNLGNAYHSLGDFKTAIDFQELHLKYARQLGDKSAEGRACGSLGMAHSRLGEFKTAISYLERSLKIAKQLDDRVGEGVTYGNFGNAYHSLGDFKTAIDCHERYLNIAKELGDRRGEGKAYNNLGNAHRSLGNLKTAIENYECRLKIAKELGDRSGEGETCGNLGNAHCSLGDFKAAINYHERHLKIMKELGDRWGEGRAYSNLGNVHNSLGNSKTALDYHEPHMKIAKELGDRSGEGRAYGNLGNAHCSLGDFQTAINCHQFDLKIANELGDRLGEGRSYGNLGNAHHSLGDFKKSVEYHERHMKIAKELGDTLGEAKACFNLGICFEDVGQVSDAIGNYQLSIKLLNNIRDRLQLKDEWKISFRDQYQTVYTALWRLMLAEGKVMEALFSAEQGRAQALKDLLALNYGFKLNDAEPEKEYKTFPELCSRTPANTIFMAFGKSELVFWVCQKGGEVALRRKQISSKDEISTFFVSLVTAMRQEIGAVGCVRTQHLHLKKSALNTLYDIIIDPIQDLLGENELIFVPEGALCLAPFAALQGPNSKYLCESFRIRVAPSLTSLMMITERPVAYHSRSGVLLVGDPWVQDVTNLSPLLFAREEVEMIGGILGCAPLIGRQATKDEVLRRLGSVALVHIAAHGSMGTGEVALAPENGENDFLLTMKDVKQVQMQAGLVVLSCCYSGHGEIKAEGVVGMARAFLGAGARSVLVSLWAIEDKATLEFMKHFYEHLLGRKSASYALNQAMNCMRKCKEFGEVRHWAPYLLIGDDVTIEFAECGITSIVQ